MNPHVLFVAGCKCCEAEYIVGQAVETKFGRVYDYLIAVPPRLEVPSVLESPTVQLASEDENVIMETNFADGVRIEFVKSGYIPECFPDDAFKMVPHQADHLVGGLRPYLEKSIEIFNLIN